MPLMIFVSAKLHFCIELFIQIYYFPDINFQLSLLKVRIQHKIHPIIERQMRYLIRFIGLVVVWIVGLMGLKNVFKVCGQN